MAVPQLHGQEVEAVTAAKDMAKAARKAEEVLQALKRCCKPWRCGRAGVWPSVAGTSGDFCKEFSGILRWKPQKKKNKDLMSNE